MMREATVDLGAIATNVEALRREVPGVVAMVVVKANGYGHGAVESASAALDGGAAWLGVADLTEAHQLRAAGIEAPVLAWLLDPDESFDDAIDARIDIGVSSISQLEAAAAASGRAEVHLKIDTGLSRNGATASDWPELVDAASAHERAGRVHVRGVWSHLANAGEAGTVAQVAAFEAALEQARTAGLEPDLAHLAATGGALRMPSCRFSMVRFGIGAYGLSPDGGAVPMLRPAMRLSASVVSVKRAPRGQGVSYGYEYVTPAETTLALVPLGYADGVPRRASGRAEVSINGVRHPVAGRIAMDQFVVDVGDSPVAVGDRAVLFGDGADGAPTATDWADWADTIPYEVVTGIGQRVPRRYTR